jgi:hypothetical protein
LLSIGQVTGSGYYKELEDRISAGEDGSEGIDLNH